MLPARRQQLHSKTGRPAEISANDAESRSILGEHQSPPAQLRFPQSGFRRTRIVHHLIAQTPAPEISKPIRVLILEHSRGDVDLVFFELSEAGFVFEPKVDENREEFLAAI